MKYNGQVNAPLVLTWMHDREFTNPSWKQEVRNDIMICATVGMMAAQEIGLNTGFCGCIEGREVSDYLGMPDKEALVILGIGTVALPAGIMASAFTEFTRRNQKTYEDKLKFMLQDDVIDKSEREELRELSEKLNLSDKDIGAIEELYKEKEKN